MFKIRVFEDSVEKLVSIDYLLSREARARDVKDIDIAFRDSRVMVLTNHPITLSETVILNGLVLTEGLNYDYTIDQNSIIFNIGILPTKGHVLVNYKYLNVGV